MGDANIFISNGTCYSAAGEELDESFIPCGNAAFGHQTCCGAGDNCLADKACFGVHGSGYGSYLTYQAGCTDPDYADESCPDKKGIDQAWIGLTRCDEDDRVWAACSQEGDPATLQPGSFCSCTDMGQATIAFTDAPSIPNTASLPQATGSSVQYFAGYVPTPSGTTAATTSDAPQAPPLSSKQPSPPTPSPSPSGGGGGGDDPPEPSQSPSPTQNLTATPTPPPLSPGDPAAGNSSLNTGGNNNSPSQTDASGNPIPSSPGSNTDDPGSSNSGSGGGLSSAAKAGIGVGAAAAALIFIAIIVALILHHRRRKRRIAPDDEDDAVGTAVGAGGRAAAGGGHKKNDSLDQPPSVSEISEADGRAARPWSMRSELEGSAVPGAAGAVGASGRNSKEEGGRGGEDDGAALSPIAELPGSVPPSRGGGEGEEDGRAGWPAGGGGQGQQQGQGGHGGGGKGDGMEGRRRVRIGGKIVYL